MLWYIVVYEYTYMISTAIPQTLPCFLARLRNAHWVCVMSVYVRVYVHIYIYMHTYTYV